MDCGGPFGWSAPSPPPQTAVEWLTASPHVVLAMFERYPRPDAALIYGSMLRETLRHQRLAAILLADPAVFPALFQCVESPHFDVASDAFATCRDLLTRHRTLVASFLHEQYDDFFKQYLLLVQSQNYVTRRQSLKLLGELLLDRSNFHVMTRFISNPEHLKMVMNLLRDTSASIQCVRPEPRVHDTLGCM